MPLIIDEKKPSRAVEMRFEVPGAVESVWRAMATGRGIGAWFVPTEVEERVGGSMRFDFGPGNDSPARVTVWEPPHRFGYVEETWSEGAPPCVTLVEIEPRADGQGCAVRMEHRLDTAEAKWDGALKSFEEGWPGYIRVLRIYARDFADQAAASFRVMMPVSGTVAEAWEILRAAGGLTTADVGGAVEIEIDAELRCVGVLERRHELPGDGLRDALIKMSSPTPGVMQLFAFSWEGKVQVGLSVIVYGEDAEATRARDEPRWRAWFDDVTCGVRRDG